MLNGIIYFNIIIDMCCLCCSYCVNTADGTSYFELYWLLSKPLVFSYFRSHDDDPSTQYNSQCIPRGVTLRHVISSTSIYGQHVPDDAALLNWPPQLHAATERQWSVSSRDIRLQPVFVCVLLGMEWFSSAGRMQTVFALWLISCWSVKCGFSSTCLVQILSRLYRPQKFQLKGFPSVSVYGTCLLLRTWSSPNLRVRYCHTIH